MNVYLEPQTVKFLVGIYAVWTTIVVMVFCDWYRENQRKPYGCEMCTSEKVNLGAWGSVTLLVLAYLIWG